MKINNFLAKFFTVILIGEIVFIVLVFGLPKSEDSVIRFFAVGDIMLERGVESMVKKEGGGDFRFPFLKIADYLKKADILFGNLESIISDKEGEKAEKTGKVRVWFKAQSEAIDGLVYAGFDIVSVANNHALDYGREAFEDSLSKLREVGIEYVGGGFDEEETFLVKIKKVKNTKIGFLAYTGAPRSWGAAKEKSGIALVNEESIEKIKKDVKEAKKEVDILIVSLHYGKEYSLKPLPVKVSFCKAFIDAGADLIIGHHPHVVQPLEKYKDGWIAYSLGNFVFDQTFKETKIGGLLEVTIRDKKIQEIKLSETENSDFFQPSLSDSQ